MNADLNKKPTALMDAERGIALVLVLWVIMLLSIVGAEFSWTMRNETATVTNFKEGEQAYYTAEAGINKAMVELMRTARKKRRAKKIVREEDEEEDQLSYWEPGAGTNLFEFAGAPCEITIEDENNKLGVDSVLKKAKKNPGFLKNMLQERMGLEGEERDIVADSLIDWYDKDHNITGINGAEDDYYKSLDPPYECRDGKVAALEELLMVRGVSEELYYGVRGKPEYKTRLQAEELEQLLSGSALEAEPEEEEVDEEEGEGPIGPPLGLADIFSIFSKSSTFKPNVNTASVEQLLLLESMDSETAREIVAARKEAPFVSTTDRLPLFANYEIWKKNITAKAPGTYGYYKIKARGFSPDKRISRSIACNVMLSSNRCYLLSWKAED